MKKKAKDTVLIIDDEPDIRELLGMSLQRLDIPCIGAATVADATKQLQNRKIGVCLTDLRLPDGNGLDIVRYANAHHPYIPIAVFTAHGNVKTAVEALKCGAFDFVCKPIRLEELTRLVSHGLSAAQDSVNGVDTKIGRLLGDSEVMQSVRRTILKVARNQAPVYISGPSGSGKELAARLIHECGPRGGGPFIAVNCGAIPFDLMESEFFGHKKGSFTGATTDTLGLFEAASGGTLFLDEVAELPLAVQVKLLRAIQEKSIRRVGETRERDTDVRLLSATHTDLAQAVADGRFRQDLYYRINVIQIDMPGLGERKDDIHTLAEHFIDKIAADGGIHLSDEAVEALKAHTYSGHVRELENIIERAIALRESNRISVEDLALGGGALVDPAGGAFVPGSEPITDYLERTERQALHAALQQSGGNQTAAARLLGISFRAIRYKLRKFGIR